MKQNQEEKNKHGGKREGAGRKKKYGEKTGIMRLPIGLIHELKQLEPFDLNVLAIELRERRYQYKASERL